jgi:hypothetical protein
MTGWAELDRLLTTNPLDSGCGHAMELLDVYAELLADNEDAALRHPDVAVHLAQCGPCSQDLTGLLEAIHNPST